MDQWRLEPARDIGLPLPQRMRSLQRESGLVGTALHVAWWSLIRAYLAVFHRLRVHGREHVPPRPPFIVVANHASHLDAMVLAAALGGRHWPRVFPIAAGDTFFDTPVSAMFAGGVMNALPMWRKKAGVHALRELRERLLVEECVYILFPEGTRSRDGAMGSFRAGLGMLVAGTEVAVVPCRLLGAFEAMPPNRPFPKPSRIEVRIGPAMVFAGHEDSRSGWESIAMAAEQAVRALGCQAGQFPASRMHSPDPAAGPASPPNSTKPD